MTSTSERRRGRRCAPYMITLLSAAIQSKPHGHVIQQGDAFGMAHRICIGHVDASKEGIIAHGLSPRTL